MKVKGLCWLEFNGQHILFISDDYEGLLCWKPDIIMISKIKYEKFKKNILVDISEESIVFVKEN